MGRTFNLNEFYAQWDSVAAEFILNQNAIHADPSTDTIITDVYGSGVDLRSVASGGLWTTTLPAVTPNDAVAVWWTNGTLHIPMTYQDIENATVFTQRINALLEPFTEQWRRVIRQVRLEDDCPITEEKIVHTALVGPYTETDIIP